MSNLKYLDKNGLTYFWGKVKGIVTPKADKVSGATAGHLAKLNAAGNIVDGGDTAPFAENITGPVVQSDAEFTWRKTAGTLSVMAAGGAVIERVKGRSLVWNQLQNNADSEESVTLDGTTNDQVIRIVSGPLIKDHKFLVSFLIKSSESVSGDVRIEDGLVTAKTIQLSTSYQKVAQLSVCSRASTAASSGVRFRPSTTSSSTVTTKDFVRYDLTLMFGAGNEPSTVAEFEAMYPEAYYDYNPGEIINNAAEGIETVGFNLWDEEWEVGGFNDDGSINKSYTTCFVSKNYNRIRPSTEYYIKSQVNVTIAYYDSTFTLISFSQTGKDVVRTTPSNAAYFKLGTAYNSGGTYNHDICINLSDASRNGQYEPYHKSVLPLNITSIRGHQEGLPPVTIFQEGAASYGNAYDEIAQETAIKRIGSQIVSGSVGDTITLVGCDTSATTFLCASDIGTLSGGVLTITAASTNVKVQYVLATPEYYTLEEPLNLSYPCDGGGTEARLPADTSSSVSAPFRADIRYAMNGMGTLQRLDDNYIPRKDMAQDAGNDPNKTISQQATTRLLNDLARRITLSGVLNDLSYFDVSGVALLKRETANMYVVRGAGLYKIPLVYGNGIHKGKENPAAYTRLGSTYTADFVNHLGNTITSPWIEKNTGCTAASVGLLWQTGTSLIDSVELIDGTDCRYLKFHVANVPATNGKAVLWVKDGSGNIMWSWEIWLCNDDLTPERIINHTGVAYDMMPVNLGAIWNAEHTKYVSGFFQWGRKDDIGTPSAYDSNTMMTFYDINNNVVTIDNYGVADDADAGGTVRSVANSIKMQDKFFLEYDATNYNWNNLPWFNNFWNAAITSSSDIADNQATAIKTIYDPCPVGYMLPAGRAWMGFTTPGTNSSTASEFNVIGSFGNGWQFKKNNADTVGTFYPASGYRLRNSGELHSVGSNGYFWSFAQYSQTYARRLGFGSGNVNPLDDGLRAYGFSVRPSREY